jgi:hypothetical protein
MSDEWFKMMDVGLAGMQHHMTDAVRQALAGAPTGRVLALVPEPTNRYDSNAVKVVDKGMDMIGYIPREHSGMVSRMLAHGYDVRCKLGAVDARYCTAVITLALPSRK